jgi:hypothetical protein
MKTVLLLFFAVILVWCVKKCKNTKTGVLPFQTQTAIKEQVNQYALPPYSSLNDPMKVTFT